MEKIRIITDSASDMPRSGFENLTVLPMSICFGDAEYWDGVTITNQEFYEKLIEGDILPTTSLVSPGAFEEAYQEAFSKGEKVVVITVSSKLSGTWQSAVLAAEDHPGDVFVVDSRNVTIGEQILVLLALELASQGLSPEEILRELEKQREKIHLLALLDTLEYLQKGGRISKSVAFVGGALSIKPVVTCRDGEIAIIGKARGSRNGSNFLMKEIESTAGVDFSKPIRLGYTGLTDVLLQKYIQDSKSLWEAHPGKLAVSHIGPTIGTHAGPGAIAVAFFER